MWSWLFVTVMAQLQPDCIRMRGAIWQEQPGVNAWNSCACEDRTAEIWGVYLEYANVTHSSSKPDLIMPPGPPLGSPRLLSCSPPCSMTNIDELVTTISSKEMRVKPFFCRGFEKNKLIEGGICYLTCPSGSTLFSRKNPLKKILPIVTCKDGKLVVYPFSDTICSEPFYDAIHIGLTIAITVGSVAVSILVAKRNWELGRSKSLYALWFESILVWLGRIYAIRRREYDDLTSHDVQYGATDQKKASGTEDSLTPGDNTGADASPTATRREAAASAAGPRYMSPEAQPASPLSIPSPAHHRMLSPAARDANSTSFGPSAMQLQREIVEKVAVSTEGDPPQQLQVDRSDDEDQDSRARAQ
eukprot:GEMP01023450.1.p1 GENE.GEMP01023450.1~~GEMP01023450.1.p1  ORF type:complete len:375 (+),score=63.72 GEMP01023450.1:51-1127(+)